MFCIACTSVNDVTIKMPAFCSECANPWGVPVDRAPHTKATTAIESTATASTTPTTWAGAASWRPDPVTEFGRDLQSRAPGLADLDERIIKHAREGRQLKVPARVEHRADGRRLSVFDRTLLNTTGHDSRGCL